MGLTLAGIGFGIQECAPQEGQTESPGGHEVSTKCSLPQIEHLSGSPSGVRVEIVIVVFESNVLQVTQPYRRLQFEGPLHANPLPAANHSSLRTPDLPWALKSEV